MKALSLALALAVTSVAAVPAVQAQQAQPAAAAVSEHGLKVGDHMPGQYTRFNRYELTNAAEFELVPAPDGYRWLRVDNTAYLVNRNTDIIVMMKVVEA